MQVENVGDGGIVWCIVLDFKPCAFVGWSTDNSEVSVTKFQKIESTGVHQFQPLIILANVGQPKIAVCAILILQVFDCRACWTDMNGVPVVNSLARVFDLEAKIG